MKVDREVAGEWRSAWAIKLLRVAWLGQEIHREEQVGGKEEANLYSVGLAGLIKVEVSGEWLSPLDSRLFRAV